MSFPATAMTKLPPSRNFSSVLVALVLLAHKGTSPSTCLTTKFPSFCIVTSAFPLDEINLSPPIKLPPGKSVSVAVGRAIATQEEAAANHIRTSSLQESASLGRMRPSVRPSFRKMRYVKQ
jgi:hypothetical protein